MTSRPQMIINTLRDNPDKKFTARELAKIFIERYADDLADKRNNPRFDTEEKFIAQIAAEIGGERTVRAKARAPMSPLVKSQGHVYIIGLKYHWKKILLLMRKLILTLLPQQVVLPSMIFTQCLLSF